jgi:hypothetical protein
MAGETERRARDRADRGVARWYDLLDNNLLAGHPKHWGSTFQTIGQIAEPATRTLGP